jgi:ankyrin repeat protein
VDNRRRAFSILRWAAFALRPLTILEITEALLIVDDDDCEDLSVDELPDTIDEEYIKSGILDLCGSFLKSQITATDGELSSMMIRLAHFSVKQYILCKMPVQDGLLILNEQLRLSNEANQSNILAILCLRYLNYKSVWQLPLQLDSGPIARPFLDYAASSWSEHAKTNGLNHTRVIRFINALFNSTNANWESWRKWFDTTGGNSKKTKLQREISLASPLFYASLLGIHDTVIYLIEEAKLDVNHIDRLNRTALQAACYKGKLSIIKLLLEKGADMAVADNEGVTPLNSASDSGHVEVVKLLLERGADVAVADNDGETPLNSALRNGHIEVVKLLLERGADVAVADNDGWTPLNLASYNGHVEVVKLLLERGADVAVADNKGWTPLNLASYSGHVEMVKLLLERGADVVVVDNNGWTLLISALCNRHVEVVKLLLERGADVAVADNEGETPLNSASCNGHVEVVKLLLEGGANIAVADNEGWMSLNLASRNGHVEVVKLLLERGADIAVADNEGKTPLNSASRNGQCRSGQAASREGC